MADNINAKALTVLTLLETGPKYGTQFAKLEPDVFATEFKIEFGMRKPAATRPQNIYPIIRRLRNEGLIEEIDVSRVANEVQDSKRKYFCLTVKGREFLDITRRMLQKTAS